MYRKILISFFIILISGCLEDSARFDLSNISKSLDMQNSSVYMYENRISIHWESEMDSDWRTKLAKNFEYSKIFYPDRSNIVHPELHNELLQVSPIIGYYPYLDFNEFRPFPAVDIDENESYSGSFMNYSPEYSNEFIYARDYYGVVALKENGKFNIYYWKMDEENITNSQNIDIRERLYNQEFTNITIVWFTQRYFFRDGNTTLLRQSVLISAITKEIVAIYVTIWKPEDGTFYFKNDYITIEYPRELHKKTTKE